MDKTNINALVQLIERSLHLRYKNRFSIKQQKFKQIWPELQSVNYMYISQKPRYLNILGGRFALVPLSTFSCGHNVMFQRRASASTAVVVSEIRRSGIARALPSFLLYIFEFPDSRCRPLVSVSDNLNPFQRCQGGKHKLCTYGAGVAKSRLAGTLSYAKTTNLSGSIFSGTPSTPCRAPP